MKTYIGNTRYKILDANGRRMMMAAKKENVLPSEYERLEYIPTTLGYLKTDYVPTSGCKVEVTFKATIATAGAFFGSRSGYQVNGFYLRIYSSSSTTIRSAEFGWRDSVNSTSLSLNGAEKHIFGVDKGTFYIDDTILATYTSEFSPQYPIYLMAINNAGSRVTAVSIPLGELYGSQCWDDNGKLVRDYIPVKRLSDDAQGLYDLVNDAFITPQ